MDIIVTRDKSRDGATIGRMIARSFHCYTLEDEVREVKGVAVSEWKIPGKTAIPVGRYRVTITPSVRFKRDMPLLENVPGFVGVRIHAGNTAEDTEGCILVGTGVAANQITQSRVAFQRLFEAIAAAIHSGEDVWVTIH